MHKSRRIVKKFTRVVAGAMVALPIIGAGVLGTTVAANANTGVDMNLVCQYTGKYDSYLARVINQTANGWQCYDRAGVHPNMGADIWGYCVNVLGYSGAYNTTNNVYGWYCA